MMSQVASIERAWDNRHRAALALAYAVVREVSSGRLDSTPNMRGKVEDFCLAEAEVTNAELESHDAILRARYREGTR